MSQAGQQGEWENALAVLAEACERAAQAVRRAARVKPEAREEAQREVDAALRAVTDAREALERAEKSPQTGSP